tara:strand:+ start:517 stop:1563 length:1047 start_codon:yes stop_codon:yes gene_type:complete
MKQHEREYFVSRLRSGFYIVEYDNIKLKVVTPSIEDEFYINQVFMDSYDNAYRQELMTQEEMLEWMYEKELWTEEDDKKIKDLEDNVEKLKIQMFENRFKTNVRETARAYLRATEKAIREESMKRDSHYENTCEGIAFINKCLEHVRRCTYLGNELCDFSTIDANRVFSLLTNSYLKEGEIRELARNEPWRTIWIMKEDTGQSLFQNSSKQGLSFDQRNICIWSRMYDNAQESTECPGEETLNDDDLLDGWFIIQRKQQEKDKLLSEVDNMTTNDKISNSEEIYIFTDSHEEADRINDANDPHSKMVRKKRLGQIKAAGGEMQDHHLQDKQLELRQMSNQQYKEKFRR